LRYFKVYIQDMTPTAVTKSGMLFVAVSGSKRLNGPFVSGACSGLRSHCQMVYSHQVSSVLCSLVTSLNIPQFLAVSVTSAVSGIAVAKPQVINDITPISIVSHRLCVRFKSLANRRFGSSGVPCDPLSRPAVRNGSNWFSLCPHHLRMAFPGGAHWCHEHCPLPRRFTCC
jgi:hypothetical protein